MVEYIPCYSHQNYTGVFYQISKSGQGQHSVYSVVSFLPGLGSRTATTTAPAAAAAMPIVADAAAAAPGAAAAQSGNQDNLAKFSNSVMYLMTRVLCVPSGGQSYSYKVTPLRN
jgi:hypothetical protein